MQSSPLRTLLTGAAAGAAATAVAVGLFGAAGHSSDEASARATAHVVGAGRKPIRAKARPRRPLVEAGQPNDPLWADSWSLAKVRAPAAWRVTSGTAETVVAVLDTGVDRGHADLQGSLVEGWDAVNEDAESMQSMSRDPSDPMVDRGRQVPEYGGDDEKAALEHLALEGVEEAQHEQMLEARNLVDEPLRSRPKRDQA